MTPLPPTEGQREITDLLRAWRGGDPAAEGQLMERVYPVLHDLARRQVARERHTTSLQVTEVLHDAYLKLVHARQTDWQDRAHFYAVAARVIRQILVDHARRLATVKHGGGVATISLSEHAGELAADGPGLLAIDDALQALAAHDPQAARIVELRYFGGLSIEETAGVLGLGRTTVVVLWRHARSWLRREISGTGTG